MLELDDDSFAGAVASGVTLVEFYGAYCPPCRELEPILGKVAETVRGRARVARVNVDEHCETAVDCLVSDIPTLVFFKDGEEAGRLFGVQKEATLVAEFDRLLAGGA